MGLEAIRDNGDSLEVWRFQTNFVQRETNPLKLCLNCFKSDFDTGNHEQALQRRLRQPDLNDEAQERCCF